MVLKLSGQVRFFPKKFELSVSFYVVGDRPERLPRVTCVFGLASAIDV